MTRAWPRVAAAVALTLLPITAAQGAPRRIADAPDPYVHRATATRFPARVGDFQRTDVTEYDQTGNDASASYDLVRNGEKLMAVSIYLYPMEPSSGVAARDTLCRTEFAGIDDAIRRSESYAGVTRTFSGAATGPGAGMTGLRMTHGFSANFAGTAQPVRSDTYLYCPGAGHWYVQYRATWPASEAAAPDLAKLMTDLPWGDGVGR